VEFDPAWISRLKQDWEHHFSLLLDFTSSLPPGTKAPSAGPLLFPRNPLFSK
jgi:hypothetical protein